jgi:hypothetical protein
MKIFTSCHFPTSMFVKKCIDIAKTVDIELIIANQPEARDFTKKINEYINKCVGIVFILEDLNEDTRNFSDWMTVEYTIANGLNLPIAIINNSDLKTPNIFPNHFEVLQRENNEIADLKIVRYLFDLQERIKVANVKPLHFEKLPFIRKFIKHHIELKKDGVVNYETMVCVKCLNDGLKDIKHSIHMNYSLCWNKKHENSEPKIDIISFDDSRNITIDSITKGNNKYTWYFIIDPPLRKDEEFKIGWRTIFTEYFPATREALKEILKQPDYPFPKNTVEHHYFINNPTEQLELELTFENGVGIEKFEALAFLGRSFSRQSLDNVECERIKDKLLVNEFLEKKVVRLEVDKPLFGRNYAISWTIK